MKRVVLCVLTVAAVVCQLGAQTVNYTPPPYVLMTSATGNPPFSPLATASGIGAVQYTPPNLVVPMCSATGLPPYSQCTFGGGGGGNLSGTLTSGYYPIATGTNTLGNGTIDFGVTGPDLLYIAATKDSSTDIELSAGRDINIEATREIQLFGSGGQIGIDNLGSIYETANGGGGSLSMYGNLGGATYLEDGGGTGAGPYANYDYVSMSNSNGSTTGELQENFIQKYQLIQLGTKSLFDYNVTNPDQVTLDSTQDAGTTLYSVSSGETDMVAGGTAELVLGDPANGTSLTDESANGMSFYTASSFDVNSNGGMDIVDNNAAGILINEQATNGYITLQSNSAPVQVIAGTTFQVYGNFSTNVLDFGVTTPNVLTLVAPVLTSGAEATTQSPGDNSTNVATTAYVRSPGAITPTTVAASTSVSAPVGTFGSVSTTGGGADNFTAIADPGSPNNGDDWYSSTTAYRRKFRGNATTQTYAWLSDIGTWGALNYPAWSSGTPFVKMTAAGTFALDTNTYQQTLTGTGIVRQTGAATELSGDATTSGSNAVSVVKVNGNTPGATCTNQFVSAIDSSARGTCSTVAHAAIAATAVTPGSYTCTNITVAADGSITSAANGSCSGGGSTPYTSWGIESAASLAVPLAGNGNANQVYDVGFISPPQGVTFSHIYINGNVADGTGLYNAEIVDASGVIVCHQASAQHVPASGVLLTITCAESSPALAGNTLYRLLTTGNATSGLVFGTGPIIVPYLASSAPGCGTSASGIIPNTCTAATPSMATVPTTRGAAFWLQ